MSASAKAEGAASRLYRSRLVSVAEALELACTKLRSAKRVLLTSHRRPDGDGTGSMCGLASLLRAQRIEAVIYSVDPIARRYRWLPLATTCVHTMSFDERFDCTIVVDCADVTLLGDTLPPPEVCGTLITLDHHASGRPFGDIAVWDPTAAAVGVLVHRIAVHEAWPVTLEAAVPLYVSLISDTGGFRHANTNAEALHVASELIRAGRRARDHRGVARGAPEPEQGAPPRQRARDPRAPLRRPGRRAQRHHRDGRRRARIVGRHRRHGQLGPQRRRRAGRRAAHHREGRRRAGLDAVAAAIGSTSARCA